MIEILWTTLAIIGAVLLFGLAIFVHEFGHFIAARLLGFQVDVFSIGFGPALWQKKVNGVVYKISAIPLGGYVSIPQLDPSGMEKIQGEGEKEATEARPPLPDMPPWKNIVVAFCGPLGNIALAVILACTICWFAPPDSTGGDTSIGFVEESSPAYANGLRAGDQIRTVNATPVASWNDFVVETHLSAAGGKTVDLTVERGNEMLTFTVPVVTTRITTVDSVSRVEGLLPKNKTSCIVRSISPGSPAEGSTIRPNDVLLEINGLKIYTAEEAIKALGGTPPFALTLQRGDETITENLTPGIFMMGNEETPRPMVGLALGTEFEIHVRRQWMQERGIAAQLTYDANSIVRLLRALFIPKHEGESGRAFKSMGGPLMIATSLYHEVRNDFWSCLGFIRFICINLAILNLLPFPVLDGGHILFALYTMIFRRRPHPSVIAVLCNTFAILLIGLMLYIVGRDVLRQFSSKEIIAEEQSAEAEPAPDPIPAEAAP